MPAASGRATLPGMEFPLAAPALPQAQSGHGQNATDLAAVTEQEIHRARGYVEASRAASTRRAYAGDWTRFQTWCAAHATPALPAPPALVAVYLSELAANGLAPASVAAPWRRSATTTGKPG